MKLNDILFTSRRKDGVFVKARKTFTDADDILDATILAIKNRPHQHSQRTVCSLPNVGSTTLREKHEFPTNKVCGTTCCAAGWISLFSGVEHDHYTGYSFMASADIGVSEHLGRFLFASEFEVGDWSQTEELERKRLIAALEFVRSTPKGTMRQSLTKERVVRHVLQEYPIRERH